MSLRRRQALDALAAARVHYTMVEHPPAYTMEEMAALEMEHLDAVGKNLFLRDSKSKRFFLVSLRGDRRADLTALGELLGVRLSFASESALRELLDLEKGSVTPLGVLNDRDRRVEVLFDEDLRNVPLMGVHPNENTATLFLRPEDLARLIRDRGNPFRWVKLP